MIRLPLLEVVDAAERRRVRRAVPGDRRRAARARVRRLGEEARALAQRRRCRCRRRRRSSRRSRDAHAARRPRPRFSRRLSERARNASAALAGRELAQRALLERRSAAACSRSSRSPPRRSWVTRAYSAETGSCQATVSPASSSSRHAGDDQDGREGAQGAAHGVAHGVSGAGRTRCRRGCPDQRRRAARASLTRSRSPGRRARGRALARGDEQRAERRSRATALHTSAPSGPTVPPASEQRRADHASSTGPRSNAPA